MKRYAANDTVDTGLYLNPRRLRFRSMDAPGRLPGTVGDRYYQVPLIVLLVAGPLIGLAFVIFLPFIGLAMFGTLVVQKLAGWIGEAATAFARVTRPSWRPLAAYLHRPRKRGTRRPRQGDQWSDEVKKEMADDDHDVA